MENRSGLEVLEYNVLVKPEEKGDHQFTDKETGRSFIIHKPDEYKDREQVSAAKGVIVGMSPLAFNYDHNAPKPQIGDEAHFPRHNALIVEGKDGETYFILKDKTIAAIVRKS